MGLRQQGPCRRFHQPRTPATHVLINPRVGRAPCSMSNVSITSSGAGTLEMDSGNISSKVAGVLSRQRRAKSRPCVTYGEYKTIFSVGGSMGTSTLPLSRSPLRRRCTCLSSGSGP